MFGQGDRQRWTESTTVLMSTTNSTTTTVNTTTLATGDVIVSSCFSNFNTFACVRSALLTFLAVLTAILCVLKIIRLHVVHHQNWHQYFIFYCASLECVICGVHWILSMYIQIDFVLQWLKLVQFLVMCHFYWTLATRALRREIWTKRFLIPFLVIAAGYFTVIAVLGIVRVKGTYVECLEPYWLELSAAEFIIVQLFCVAGFYITRRLNEISTLDSVRRSQKRDLWCIVVVFEVSALVSVIYDLTIQIVGDREHGCSAIFNQSQELFSSIFFVFMVMKLMCPIWVMLFVFQPTPPAVMENDDLIPALSEDGTSAFSSTIDEQYRQLYHPTEDYRSYGSEFLSPNTPTPTTPSNGQIKQPPQQSSLGTIREESHHSNGSHPQAPSTNTSIQQPVASSNTQQPAQSNTVKVDADEADGTPVPRGKFYI